VQGAENPQSEPDLTRVGEILAPFGHVPTSRDRVHHAAQNVSVHEVLPGLRELLPCLGKVLPRLAGLLPSLAKVLPRLVKFSGGSVISNSTHGVKGDPAFAVVATLLSILLLRFGP